jgi:hypothetical protein
MKILILMIYNETEPYNKMLSLQKNYVHKNPNVDTYFIKFENQEQEIVIENNIITFKGEENFMNILEKTLLAFDYLFNIENKKYDYVIRSNISTLININNLIKVLENAPKNNLYTGGLCLNINWICERSGLDEKTIEKYNLKNFRFVQGTSIILSFDVAKYILNNQELMDKNIIDDVSIALFLRDYNIDAYNHVITSNGIASIGMMSYHDDNVFIRNSLWSSDNIDRKLDIEHMTHVVSLFNN